MTQISNTERDSDEKGWPEVTFCGSTFKLIDVGGTAEFNTKNELEINGPYEIISPNIILLFPAEWDRGRENKVLGKILLSELGKADKHSNMARALHRMLRMIHDDRDIGRKSRKQFAEMLYDPDGAVRPSVWAELKDTRRTLMEEVQDLHSDLVESAKQTAKSEEGYSSLEVLANDFWDRQSRFEALDAILSCFRETGELPTEWAFLRVFEDLFLRHNANSIELAKRIIEVYEEDGTEYTSRSSLLAEVADREYSAGTPAKTVENNIHGLYPNAKNSGRPSKLESKKLLEEMVRRCRVAVADYEDRDLQAGLLFK